MLATSQLRERNQPAVLAYLGGDGNGQRDSFVGRVLRPVSDRDLLTVHWLLVNTTRSPCTERRATAFQTRPARSATPELCELDALPVAAPAVATALAAAPITAQLAQSAMTLLCLRMCFI